MAEPAKPDALHADEGDPIEFHEHNLDVDLIYEFLGGESLDASQKAKLRKSLQAFFFLFVALPQLDGRVKTAAEVVHQAANAEEIDLVAFREAWGVCQGSLFARMRRERPARVLLGREKITARRAPPPA